MLFRCLREKMPKLYSDFINMVPFGEYTNPKHGPMNMATHMPEGSVPPDLGPKSYIAYGRTSERGPGDSVTRLHLDLADAVNVLMHSVDAFNEEKEGAGAVWHLFRREDRRGLEDFLMRNQAKLHYARCGDRLSQATVAHPIHDQVFMLTSEDLAQLQKEESVQPWTIEQNDHEAIFVPGGVAHQVRNRRSCIKVALDYVSPESSCVSCDDNVRDFAKLRRSEGLQGRMMASAAARNAMAVLKAERCGNESDG
jgi:lysine-specific demethylase 3